MKRLVTLLLAAGLVFGAAGAAKAVDFKVSGYWQFGFDWTNAGYAGKSQGKGAEGDRFAAGQRFRTQIDVIASENLKGVVQFEIGKTLWGTDGGKWGTDGKDVKVRYSYVDWVVPQTDLKIRMGLQPFSLPEFVGAGAAVFSTDGAGIVASYDVNEMVGFSLFWSRAYNDYDYEAGGSIDADHHNAFDVVGLTVPVKADGFKVTPWAMYANMGRNANTSVEEEIDFESQSIKKIYKSGIPAGVLPRGGYKLADDDQGQAWWAGFGGEVTLFDPFRVAMEFAYGNADFGSTADGVDMERKGWYAALLAEYKLDMMTPGLLFWYASGDDDDANDGSERMPTLVTGDNSTWAALSLAYDGVPFTPRSTQVLNGTESSMMGSWGVVAQLKDISFLENLKHTLRAGYIRGTNDAEMIKSAALVGLPGDYLTEDDWAWEVDFLTDYQIYENLSMVVDFAYMRVDWDSAWKDAGHDLEKNFYRAGLYLRYAF